MGGGVGSLVVAASPPGWDSNSFCRVDLCLHYIPISLVTSWLGLAEAERGWPRSPVKTSGDKGYLNILKSSSESEASMTSSSSLLEGWDKVATSSAAHWNSNATLGMPSGIGVVVKMPSGMGPVVRKPGAATLIRCR